MDQTTPQEQSTETEEQGAEGYQRYTRQPRPMIRITISDAKQIHYKNIEFLRQFVNDRGRLRPRRQTGISAHQQRLIAQAVKRARHMALLPFDHEIER